MTDPRDHQQPEIPPAVDPWATSELPSDPTSTPTPTTLPQAVAQHPGEPQRGVAVVPSAVESADWEPAPYYGGRTGRRALVVVAVLALAVVVGAFSFALAGKRNWFSSQGTPGTSTPSASSTPPTSPASSGPYDGTPAQGYAKGEAGIVLPAAVALPGFTAEQVTAGLQQVKKAMIAARLDPKMLTSHDNSVLLDLLAQDNRPDIRDAFAKTKFLGFATQLGSGQTLSNDPVRVKGTVTTSAGTSSGGIHLMKVDTNFVWVYGFDGPSTTPGQHMVTIHDQVSWFLAADSEVNASSRGLYLSEWRSYTFNMDCTLVKQDLIGLGQPSTVSTGPSVDVNRLLDPSSSLDIGANTC